MAASQQERKGEEDHVYDELLAEHSVKALMTPRRLSQI